MKNISRVFILSLSLLISTFSLEAQSSASFDSYEPLLSEEGEVAAPGTIFNFISQEDIVKITLTSDFENLITNKNKNEYQEATLTLDSEAGAEEYDVNIKARGKFRRRTCSFPPIKVKFKKSGLQDKGLNTDHKSLKLVTHCMDDEDAAQTLLKEYVAYKMYNALTDASFKVQLVEVNYINNSGIPSSTINYGFLIENTNELAERVGGVELEDKFNVTLDSINDRYSHLIPMFQYLIGNVDWRPPMGQNVKIIEKESGDMIMVPYDFDFAGIVDAPYAIPNSDHKQTDIRQRIYLNRVDDLSELTPTIRFFQSHKKELISIIKDCEYLTKKNKRIMASYVIEFYSILNDYKMSHAAFVKF